MILLVGRDGIEPSTNRLKVYYLNYNLLKKQHYYNRAILTNV